MTGAYVWWIDNDELVVALDNGDGTYTAPDESGNAIRVYCTGLTTDLGNSTGAQLTELPIPVQFHMAIVNGAIADGYLLPGKDKGVSILFEQKYREGVADGQVYASRERSGDTISAKPVYLFGVDET